MIVLESIIAIAFSFGIFGLHNAVTIIILVTISLVLLLYALFEFITPFAYFTVDYVNIYENPFFVKRILKSQIKSVKSSKGRFVVIYCKSSGQLVVRLKSAHVKDKLRFIRELHNISKRNAVFDVVMEMKS